jgi:hypothetical protein
MTAKDLKLDYFKFYVIANRDAAADLTVRGQFDPRPVKMQLRLLDYFANPVSKNGEPIYNKNAHLTWYHGVQPAEPFRSASIENQFGRFEIRTGTGWGLLVPSQKIETGSVFPQELDHFKVYRLADVIQPPTATLKLRDQFGTEEVRLNYPLYFAVPVVKRVAQQTFPIHNDRAHLMIFSITNQKFEKTVKVRNQFTRSTALTVVHSTMLAVPSLKHEWKLL